jgi:drug/metabolite transporter (DMT)-like permease
MPGWVVLSLIAMAASVVKVLVVKRRCRQIDSRVVILTGRLVSTAVLLPMLWIVGDGLPTDGLFWGVTVTTAVITAVASILITEAIRKGPLALVIPAQAVVPVFSLLTLWVFWRESPAPAAVVLMLLSMAAVAWMLYASYCREDRAGKRTFYALLSLAAAVLFGVSTVLDRVAIARVADGALAYAACWSAVSVVLVGGECLRKCRTGAVLLPGREAVGPLAVFSLAVLIFFYAQQVAVQWSLGIDGAVVNVKSLVTLHLPVVVLIGLLVFREQVSRQALVAGLIALASGLALLRVMW